MHNLESEDFIIYIYTIQHPYCHICVAKRETGQSRVHLLERPEAIIFDLGSSQGRCTRCSYCWHVYTHIIIIFFSFILHICFFVVLAGMYAGAGRMMICNFVYYDANMYYDEFFHGKLMHEMAVFLNTWHFYFYR